MIAIYYFFSKIIGILLLILVIFLLIKLILFIIKTLFQVGIESIRNISFRFNPWNSYCQFPDYLTETDLENMAIGAVYSNRISVYANGPIIYGEVLSMSGLSTWEFQLSFNDHHRITGSYYISSDNYDSSIPENIGNQIKKEIRYRRRHKRDYLPRKH